MKPDKQTRRLAIIGGGPSGLFIFKRLIETGNTLLSIDIFEKTETLGSGMPYSRYGALKEHITNVSGNEIPDIVTPIRDWIRTLPKAAVGEFGIDPDRYNDYKVMPRLLFGKYLETQFELLENQAKEAGIVTKIHLNTPVIDVIDKAEEDIVIVETNGGQVKFDIVIICTGHYWPKVHEGTVPGYYDSPYPPVKLNLKINSPVAIRGASLTAIDAIRTLARNNGTFQAKENKKLVYTPSEHAGDFRIVMHSRQGLLPAIRFHLEDSHLSKDELVSTEEISKNIADNGGFLSLDFIFEMDFKQSIRKRDPELYQEIKDMKVEDFVNSMMSKRESVPAFLFFKGEYAEAEKSIRSRKSVYWKEALAILSFAMNYPAKHFSAEDMLRLQKVLMPLISIVIAFVPQSSCEEMIALYDAGLLELVSVGEESKVEPHEEGGVTYILKDEKGKSAATRYDTYVDCVGQPHLSLSAFPFKSLVRENTLYPARIKFKSAEEGRQQLENGNHQVEMDDEVSYYLKVPGIAINDNFQVINKYGAFNNRVYVMAVPYIGGYNPDYSGLDFCEEASRAIVKGIFGTLADQNLVVQ